MKDHDREEVMSRTLAFIQRHAVTVQPLSERVKSDEAREQSA